jgi:iron complex transport system substrate-binding protein
MAGWLLPFKAILAGLVLVSGSAQWADASEVVSTSLCADGYVLAVQPAGQIKALSWQVNGPLSRAPANLRKLPKVRAESETLLAMAPANVVLGPGDPVTSTRLAKDRGSQIHQIKWQDSFAGINENLRALGKFLQQSERAEQQIQAQTSNLDALGKRTQARSRAPYVLYLTPTLGTAGKGSFVDAAIRAAGGRNLATEFGITGWGQVPLERLLTRKPDLIVRSFFADGPPSVNEFRARHPILQNLQEDVPMVTIPGGLWVCAGPDLIDAAGLIADGLDQIRNGSQP